MLLAQVSAQVRRKGQDEAEKLDGQLRKLLEDKGLLIQEGDRLLVDIRKINKQYLPTRAIEKPALEYRDFYEMYLAYRGMVDSRTPEKFLKLTYGKQKHDEGYIRAGGSGGLPFNITTQRFEEPTIEASVGVRTQKTGMDTLKLEAGVSYGEEEKVEPFVGVEKAGFFARLKDGIKKFVAGIAEGIMSITATIEKGVTYLFSITLGPWIGNVNLETGKLGGSFSWILAAYEWVVKAVQRGAQPGPKVLVSELDAPSFKEGETIKGLSAKGEEVSLTLANVKGKESGNVEFTCQGKKYVAIPQENGETIVYEKQGFWKRLGRALNPIELAKDLWDVVAVGPWLRLRDAIDGFRKLPEHQKLSEQEVEKLERKMNQAFMRGNLSTARRVAVQLLENAEQPMAKAEYMLNLDRIEWKIAHSGSPFWYVPGMGFGNKRKRLEASVENRIKESLEKLEHGTKEEREAAHTYLSMKATFRRTPSGKRVPIEPLPEALTNRVIEAVAKAERTDSAIDMQARQRGGTAVDFASLGSKPKLGEIGGFLSYLQELYEKTEAPGRRDMLTVFYGNFQRDPDVALAFARAFSKNLEKAGRALPRPEDLQNMNGVQLDELYNAGIAKRRSQ